MKTAILQCLQHFSGKNSKNVMKCHYVDNWLPIWKVNFCFCEVWSSCQISRIFAMDSEFYVKKYIEIITTEIKTETNRHWNACHDVEIKVVEINAEINALYSLNDFRILFKLLHFIDRQFSSKRTQGYFWTWLLKDVCRALALCLCC